jgi:hypothetical protein
LPLDRPRQYSHANSRCRSCEAASAPAQHSQRRGGLLAAAAAVAVGLAFAVGCSRDIGSATQPVVAGAVVAVDQLGRSASPSVELVDVEGRVHRPFDDPQVRALLLMFLVPDCPIANSYMPELNRLFADYESRGVRLFVIHVDPDLSVTAARDHARAYGLLAPVVLDAEHVWVRKTGATVTPEAAVLNPAGELLYRGRIDDRFVGLGKRREQVTQYDLRDALDAILRDHPVTHTQTTAIGCPIPTLRTPE